MNPSGPRANDSAAHILISDLREDTGRKEVRNSLKKARSEPVSRFGVPFSNGSTEAGGPLRVDPEPP